MLDTPVETGVKPRLSLAYLNAVDRATRHTATVNSFEGLKTETFDKNQPRKGLYSCGLSTCTAVGGYYMQNGEMNLFLAHISPTVNPEALLQRLDMNGVERVTLNILNGKGTKPDRNAKLKQIIEKYFHDQHINIDLFPESQKRIIAASPGQEYHSYGASLVFENTGDSIWQPIFTIIEEM